MSALRIKECFSRCSNSSLLLLAFLTCGNCVFLKSDIMNHTKFQEDLFQFAEVEMIYKRKPTCKPIKACSSQEVADVLRSVYPADRLDYKEFFYIALLSRNNEILGVSRIGEGSTNGTVVNIKEVFQLALKANASSIVLSHNHPSGGLEPSRADLRLTKKIQEFANLIDVIILDHIILTSSSYKSFADDGLL